MSDATLNLLLQIPLAGVVVFVVLMFLQHLDKSNQRQDEAQKRMLEFLSTQEETNRAFLKEQREEHAKGIARLANEIKTMGQQVSKLNGRMLAHDEAIKARAEKV